LRLKLLALPWQLQEPVCCEVLQQAPQGWQPVHQNYYANDQRSGTLQLAIQCPRSSSRLPTRLLMAKVHHHRSPPVFAPAPLPALPESRKCRSVLSEPLSLLRLQFRQQLPCRLWQERLRQEAMIVARPPLQVPTTLAPAVMRRLVQLSALQELPLLRCPREAPVLWAQTRQQRQQRLLRFARCLQFSQCLERCAQRLSHGWSRNPSLTD